MLPVSYRVARQAPGPARHLDARARARGGDGVGDVPARPVRDALRLRRGRGADLGQRRWPSRRAARAHDPRRRRGHQRALRARARATSVGVRGPFGSSWPLAEAEGGDVVVVAGGIGLAPLRPAIEHADRRTATATGAVIAALRRALPRARCCSSSELERWREAGIDVEVHGRRRRGGLGRAGGARDEADPDRRLRGREDHGDGLRPRGDDALRRQRAPASAACPRSDIHVSLERNMKCAVGHCGHCQLAHRFVCKDGPVFPAGPDRDRCWGCGSCERRTRPRSWRSGSSPPATAASSRCSTSSTSWSRCPTQIEVAYFLEATRGDRRGPLRPLAGRGLDHHPARRRADPGGPRASRVGW